MILFDSIKEKVLKLIESNKLFFISYFLIVFSDVFDNISYLQNYLILIDMLSIFLLIIIIGRFWYLEKKSFLRKNSILILFLIVSIICAYFSTNRFLLKLTFLLLASVNLDFDIFIRNDLKIRLVLVLSIMFLYFIGKTDIGIVEYRNGLMRNAFGMGHPNSFAFYLTMICVDIYYLDYTKNIKSSNFTFIIASLVLIFNYLFLGSRTNIILLLGITLIFLFNKYLKGLESIKKLLLHSFTIGLILSLFLGYTYTDNVFYNFLNKLLSNRVFLSNTFLNRYNINMFGNRIITYEYYILDNAYINIILGFGIVFTIFFAFLFYNLFKKLYINQKYTLIAIVCLILLFGISESPIYIPAKNPFILLLAQRLGDSIIERKLKNDT